MSRHRTQQQWRDLCQRQMSSGLSVEAFCRQHGIGVSTLFAWRRRLAITQPPAFVELTPSLREAPATPPSIAPPAPATSTAWIEVVSPGGLVVRVQPGFDPVTLRQVLEVLS